MTPRELPRKLGLLDAAAIVVGAIIGSGIFIVPGAVARDLPSTAMIFAVWIAAGALSLFGALAYAELGAMLPYSGGQYVYLRESYGSIWAFLFGWALLLVVRSGSTATLAVGFAIYLAQFIPLSPFFHRLIAAGIVLVLTFINCRGVMEGAAVQKTTTFLKVAGLLLLTAGALAVPLPWALEWSAQPGAPSLSRFGVAMIACLWSYNGWFQVGFVAGEIKNPQRNLPLSLGGSLAIIILLYIIANIAYMKVLSIGEIAATDRVAAVVAERVFGSSGAIIFSLTILVSILGALNAGILTAPRVYFAQARDGLFFRKFGEVHPRFETPALAILLQGFWAAILSLSGSYVGLLSFAMFAAWIFYGMTVFGVIVLRRKHPDWKRPYRMWGYPITPIVFAAVSFWLVVNNLVSTPGPSLSGLLLLGSGIPAYYLWRRKARS
jgi:APA family basic amino acid/polyamine antiporter